MRPTLSKDMDINLFRNYNWLKNELIAFCRQEGLSVTGKKSELEGRIELYILTGEIEKPLGKNVTKRKQLDSLSLDTVITENHTCNLQVRYFFGSIIPRFSFTKHIQQYFKENVGKTYRDVVDEWFKEELRKKDEDLKKVLEPQPESDRFITDFLLDTKNTGKTLEDAIKAWEKVKAQKQN